MGAGCGAPSTPCPGLSHHCGLCRMVLTQRFKAARASWALCRMSLDQFGFALFYIYIYIFFGILYMAVGVKIVF